MNQEDKYNDEIDLYELFIIAWNKKFFLVSLTSIFAIISVIYSLSLPNVYTSTSLLAPSNQEDTFTSRLGGMSGLASIAGVNLSQSNATTSDEAIGRVKSFNFFSNYILPNIKLENLLAVKEWVSESNTIIYDQGVFDSKTNKWLGNDFNINNTQPSNQQAYRRYSDIFSINVDEENGFVSFSIKHQSPELAKKWLDLIIYNINESMREIDKRDAQNAINFLNESTNTTSIQSIREVISALLESKMQTLMLASTNKDYVFKVLDSPIVPELKSGPYRSIICLIGTLIGGFISLLIVFIQHYRKQT
tara:strand:- start:2403 stop:3317 length:915 start_codon:yes stop_codon:yes gene_type:complete